MCPATPQPSPFAALSSFPDWALYHSGDFSYTADKLAPIANKLGNLNYAFMYFCPPPGTDPMPYWALPPYGSCSDATAFQLMSVEPHDAGFLQTINGYKATNANLKVYLSIGGWNFPSAYWSAMAATAATRATFIQSVIAWLNQYSVDGVDMYVWRAQPRKKKYASGALISHPARPRTPQQ